MANLISDNLVKIIMVVFIVAILAVALFLFFKNQVIDFFKNIIDVEPSKFILGILKC